MIQRDNDAVNEPELPSPEDEEGDILVTIAGTLMLVKLGLLDAVLAIGIIAALKLGPLGWFAELILIPLEFMSFNLTIYAAQMAATGSRNHDPLPILHAKYPNVLPYKP